MVPPCFALRPRVFHRDPVFSTTPRDPGPTFTPCEPVFFTRKPVNGKKKKIKMLLACLGSVRTGKNCDYVCIGKNRDLGHSFSPYGPALSRPITYIYSRENKKDKICKKHQSDLHRKKHLLLHHFSCNGMYLPSMYNSKLWRRNVCYKK